MLIDKKNLGVRNKDRVITGLLGYGGNLYNSILKDVHYLCLSYASIIFSIFLVMQNYYNIFTILMFIAAMISILLEYIQSKLDSESSLYDLTEMYIRDISDYEIENAIDDQKDEIKNMCDKILDDHKKSKDTSLLSRMIEKYSRLLVQTKFTLFILNCFLITVNFISLL